jgi:hypothetical protein
MSESPLSPESEEPDEEFEPLEVAVSDLNGWPAQEVLSPTRWRFNPYEMVLFDDKYYSVVTGTYLGSDGNEYPDTLGERWNISGGNQRKGFPITRGNPAWHVVPEFLEVPILHGLLDELATDPNSQRPEANITPGTEAQVRRLRILLALEVRFGNA